MSTILNVLANANGPMVVDAKEFDAAISRGIAEAQAVHAKNDAKREETLWRDELSVLSQRLLGRPTLEQAQNTLASLQAEIKSLTDQAKSKALAVSKSLATPYLSNAERTELVKSLKNLEEVAANIHTATRVRLAQAEDAVRQAEVLDPLRPRLAELKARAKAIDSALQV